MSLTRIVAILSLATAFAACRDEARLAPTPTSYAWPDSFAFKMELVAESRADSAVVVRYEERKELVLAVRDDRYLVWHDSLVKESVRPGASYVPEPYAVEDTLHYYVELNRRGQVTHSEPGCDPALPACRAALPSALPLELLRLVPRLPVWPPPRGASWTDTLYYDDAPRPRGVRGTVVTTYRVAADTVVAGTPLWKVVWRAVHQTYEVAPGPVGVIPREPVEETGVTYVDKQRAIPVFSMWGGGGATPPGIRRLGVTATVFRGRAYLAGSVIERLLGPPE